MTLTRTRFRRVIRVTGVALVCVAIIGYVSWRSLPYARGPHIDVFEPVDGSAISGPTIDVIGRAERVASLFLNGSLISINEQGGFKETLIVFPGVNTLTLRATDQFGRGTEARIEIFGTTPLPTASTTNRR
jgi:hypothetical protein